jgi:thiol:disulfide interchange protein DsbC
VDKVLIKKALIAAAVLAGGTLVAGYSAVAEEDDPRAAIAEMLPGIEADDVRETPLPDIYEVTLGAQIVYVTADRRYLLKGDIIDLNTNESLTEARRDELRRTQLASIDESSMVTFGPADSKYTITVFTDVDCTFCRKLHQEIGQFNDNSIRVRYLFYPRHGPGSDGWNKADAVWCSKDQQEAMTRAKRGESIEAEDCGATPVASHYELGNRVGVRGTPAILLENGQLISGYVPAKELAAYLNGHKGGTR